MATIVPAQGAERARRRRHSRFHSTLLLLAMAALLGFCGWVVADWRGVLWGLLASAAMLVVLRRIPSNIFLQALNARALARREAPELYQMLDDLCHIAGVGSSPLLCRVVRPVPIAFTIGDGDRATIVLSESLSRP
jgi:heat shock protein HtpX